MPTEVERAIRVANLFLETRPISSRPLDPLRDAAISMISSGNLDPKSIEAKYVLEVLRGERKHSKGPSGLGYIDRNWVIGEVVGLVAALGFAPTRSAATKYKQNMESACSIVQKVLMQRGIAMGEDAVNKIWATYKDNLSEE